MKKPHKTARGRPIDMDSIIKQNENTIAVGNTRTNAKGDILGKNNEVLIPVEKISRKQANYTEPADTVKMSDTDKITKKTKKTKPSARKEKRIVEKRERKDEDGNIIEEIEYDDGSIEVKNINEGDDNDDDDNNENN